MIQVHTMVFNDFRVNTSIVYDASGECVIVDAGCNDEEEYAELKSYLKQNHLRPVKLLNTHYHIDHITGNKYFKEEMDLKVVAHKNNEYLLDDTILSFMGFGKLKKDIASIDEYIAEGDTISFGDSELEVIEAPGHTKGCVVYYSPTAGFAIVGDVLFSGSIGRTDLPGGDYDVLMESLKKITSKLPEDTKVYCGHGPSTTIGYELRSNPFLEFLH